jgi:beta-mannosidase
VTLCVADEFHMHDLDARVSIEGAEGVLRARVTKARFDALGGYALSCGEVSAPFLQDADGAWRCELRLPNVELWQAHTHGAPKLYPIFLDGGGWKIWWTSIGFRTIAIDKGADGKGFGLVVNGEPVFCRGPNWTTPDLVALPGARADLEPQLTRMRDAGMNMVRVTGNMFYESEDFFRLCDELGLLVWQDFPFANFDYPADETFTASVKREATQFLRRTPTAPSLAVLCGGTETMQQAAMLGLPQGLQSNAIFDEILPNLARELRPDAVYIPNSPYGGALPFQPGEGVSHYYGVSAYKRPLEDARLANVRFASECLCFANVPDYVAVELLTDRAEILHRDFAARVDYDAGAEWFFEGVRNHYLQLLYGVDPDTLRRDNPALYLDMSRAVSAEVMEHVFAQWRRPGSPTRGGLVWFLRDLAPGAGWGVLDFKGLPKAAWYGLKRAFRPVQALLIDEGLNGLDAHLINETAAAIEARLTLHCLRDGAATAVYAERNVTLPPRSSLTLRATDLWGAFFDTTYAYRFGPPAHDVSIATLTSTDGAQLAQAVHFPLGRGAQKRETGLYAETKRVKGNWVLDISCEALAQSVCIADAAYEPEDNWFHLAPGKTRRIALTLLDKDSAALPDGHVRALNATARAHYGAIQCKH